MLEPEGTTIILSAFLILETEDEKVHVLSKMLYVIALSQLGLEFRSMMI